MGRGGEPGKTGGPATPPPGSFTLNQMRLVGHLTVCVLAGAAGKGRARPGALGPHPLPADRGQSSKQEAGTWTTGLQPPPPRNPLRARLGGPGKKISPALPGPRSAGRETRRLCAQPTAICSAHVCKAPTVCWCLSLPGRSHQGPASSRWRKAPPWFTRSRVTRAYCAPAQGPSVCWGCREP